MIITVNSGIEIEDPDKEVTRWCMANLILDNPQYAKNERLGYSNYNTPRQIQLYEVVGNIYRLPFGCLDNLWQKYKDYVPFNSEIKPIEHFSYRSNIKPYPYQENAIKRAITVKNGILVAPCGGGKTNVALEIIARIGGRALWLTHTQELLTQSMARAKALFDCEGYGTITSGKINIGEGLTFATVQTMAKIDLEKYKDVWDVVVVDECMPGETLIDTPNGKKELKNLCIDDIITSYNRTTGEIENKRVLHVFKNPAHDIVKVELENGDVITCTSNHPIFTRRGWIDAERLESNDYVMRLVWQGDRLEPPFKDELFSLKKTRMGVLLQRVLHEWKKKQKCMDGRTPQKCIGNDEENKRAVSRAVCGANENRQSNEKAGSAKGCIRQAKRDRTQAKDKMWKRSRANRTTTNVDDSISGKSRGLRRVSDTNKNVKRQRLSNLLQGRYCNTNRNDCDRGRRRFTQFNRTPRTGQKERYLFEWVRVESVAIQEQTSDGTFGGMCSDGYVYNVEVEDNNNYFANGILVHNCQHLSGSPTQVTQYYKVMNSLSARYKYGLTATPYRGDGLTKAMFALVGNTIYTITKEDVADTTCPVKVRRIDTGYEPLDLSAVLNADGTLDYHSLVADLTSNDARYLLISHEINSLDGSTIVLANRVEYLNRLKNAYEGKAVCLSGLTASKRNKEMRKKALSDLQSGEIDCIFATYSLAAEGLDCPGLRYVVFATPEKDERIITQSVGRVARKCEGKEYGTVIDFVDCFGLFKGYASRRKTIYKKLDCEVLE